MDTCNKVNESQRQVRWKEPGIWNDILNDPINMKSLGKAKL